ncbi:MAG: hypothetical protein ABJL67_08360 [Sulfitobacter sp.]
MTDLATLAATQRRSCRTRKAMLRQQHVQTSMSAKARILSVRLPRSERRFFPNRSLVF